MRARRGSGRTVLSDVAKRAGVSTATVSRVYNEPGKVSDSVRERVEQAAQALNWIPNPAGRALASTRSHIAGIVIPTLDDQIFASQVSGMQAAFAARGITLFLGCSNYDPKQALSQVNAMLSRGVEAIAVVGEAHPPELFEALRVRRSRDRTRSASAAHDDARRYARDRHRRCTASAGCAGWACHARGVRRAGSS